MRTASPGRRHRTRAVALVAATVVTSLLTTFLDASGLPAQASAPGRVVARFGTAVSAGRVAARTDPATTTQLASYAGDTYDHDGTVRNLAGGASATLQGGAKLDQGQTSPHRYLGYPVKLDGVAAVLSSPVVVPTDGSFTVAAWARLDKVDRPQVVLSQDGGQVSGFALRTDQNGNWVFAVPQTDSADAVRDAAVGPKAVAGEWVQLTGVYDAGAGELRLYVNGAKAATGRHPAAWAASGGLQVGRGLTAGAPSDFAAGYVDEAQAWSGTLSDEAIGELVVDPAVARQDRCAVGHWLHAGGPEVKALASSALAGTDLQRRLALQSVVVNGSQLEAARFRDDAVYGKLFQNQSDRYTAWGGVLQGLDVWNSEFQTFHQVPSYGEAVHRFLLERNDPQWHNYFDVPAPPKPGQDALDRALAIAADLRAAYPSSLTTPQDWQVKTWSANRIERFIRFGGYPTVAPVPGSPEFRFEVESVKLNWSDCDTGDPDGTTAWNSYVTQSGPLADVTLTAKREWNSELAGQAQQRNTIVAAEIQTMTDLRTASEAMIETQGQAWVVGQLLKWQKYWLSQPKSDLHYPKAADFTRVKTAVTTAQNAIAAQLTIAHQAVTSSNAQVTKVTTAQQQAADIATAAGLPVYRGLAYARQSAQVAKASAAATLATSKAIETTLNSAKAAKADGAALEALAATQQAAQQAEFRRVAAQEAAAQAKAAADAAAAQAAQAAQMAARAKQDRAVAEQAEAAAKTAADNAHAKRLVAEQERDKAAAARATADAERTKAQAAEATAQQQQTV